MTFLSGKRTSGILAHIASLPSPYGIDDIGLSSYNFLSFLENANNVGTFYQPK